MDPRTQPLLSSGTRTRQRSRMQRLAGSKDAQTPPPNKKVLERKPIKKNKFSQRKYFSVKEDWTILDYWSSNLGDMSTREISDNLAEKLDHSSESIRDRIKRYISKMKSMDKRLLEEEAKVNPEYYAHFKTDKSRNKKVITHFSAQQPRIAGSTLTQNEKRAIMRELRRKKKEKVNSARTTPKKTKPPMSPEKLKEIKQEAIIKADKYKTKLRKRTPQKTLYDPFKEIEDLLKPQKTKKISSGSKLLRPKSRSKPHRKLNEKVETFLGQLDSTNDQDVECNAEILAEIIKSFAVTFSLEISDIVKIIEESGGPLNMENIRTMLMNKAK